MQDTDDDQEKGVSMSSEAQTAEIVESQPENRPSPAPQRPGGAPMTLFGTTNPAEVIERATETATALTGIINDRQLYKQIRDRKHILIEGWTLLGSMVGVFASTAEGTSSPVETNGEWKPPTFRKDGDRWVLDQPGVGGWEARSEARTLDGRLVAAAESECRWEETTWRSRDSHALRSMAQTRAQSKALASALRFIVELAGFSGTPAEEMVEDYGQGDGNGRVYEHAEGHPVYDNRGDSRSVPKSQGGPGWPVFKCKRKDCQMGKDGRPWATWDPHYFDDPEVKAKKALVDVVRKHSKGWDIYYDPEDPAIDDDLKALVESIKSDEEPDPAQMAGVMWTEITTEVNATQDKTLEETGGWDTIPRTALIILSRVEADSNDIPTVVGAWGEAIRQLDEEDLEREAEAHGYGY